MIQLQLTKTMKTSHILGTAILIVIILATASVIMAFNQPAEPAAKIYTSSIQAQATTQPDVTDQSEIGSTDGIMVMGVVIFTIVTIPIVLRKKRK